MATIAEHLVNKIKNLGHPELKVFLVTNDNRVELKSEDRMLFYCSERILLAGKVGTLMIPYNSESPYKYNGGHLWETDLDTMDPKEKNFSFKDTYGGEYKLEFEDGKFYFISFLSQGKVA